MNSDPFFFSSFCGSKKIKKSTRPIIVGDGVYFVIFFVFVGGPFIRDNRSRDARSLAKFASSIVPRNRDSYFAIDGN